MPAQKEPVPNFESALEKLESIVHSMESGQLPLEELLARYEEGTRWIRFCQEKLADAEKRIEVISRSAAGKPQLSEFDSETPSKKSAATRPAPEGGASQAGAADDLLLS